MRTTGSGGADVDPRRAAGEGGEGGQRRETALGHGGLPGDAGAEDTGRSSAHAVRQRVRAQDQAGRTSGPVLGGSVRESLRIGSPPSRTGPPVLRGGRRPSCHALSSPSPRPGEHGQRLPAKSPGRERARRRPGGGRSPCRARSPGPCARRPSSSHGSADSTSVSASIRARRSLPSAVSAVVVDQSALDQRGASRRPTRSSLQPRVALAAGQGEAAAGGGVRDQRLEAVQVGVQQRGDVPVAAVLAQQGRRVPQVQQRLAGPGEVGVPGVERAPLGGQRVAGLAQQPGQLGELRRVDGVGAEQPGQRARGRRPSGRRRPAPGRRASRPAGSCARPGTARSCRRSPSPPRHRRRPSAPPARRSRTSGPGAGRAR